jgi:ankyrin repeat protein
MSNDLEMAKALVKKGANLSAKTQDGQTPLDFAKKKNSTEVAAYLGSLAK